MNALLIPLGVVGWPQILLIVVIILLLFGGKKIPEMMRGLGSGLKEFKDASKDEDKTNANPNTNTSNKVDENPKF